VYSRVNAIFREGKETDMTALLKRLDFSATMPELKEFFLSLARKD
jgi:hypothetical protein